MNLQVMDALGISKAFVLGTSQGGWITVQMALVDRIEGLLPLGTSMDYESARSRELGCWDGVAACTGPINQWTVADPLLEFSPDTPYCDFLIDYNSRIHFAPLRGKMDAPSLSFFPFLPRSDQSRQSPLPFLLD